MKTSVETTPDITLESPAELLSAVPYLVGYVPAESMVVIGLTDKQIGLTACTPLPSADEPPGRIGVTAQVLRRNDVQAAVIVGYGPRERVARSVDYMRGVLDEAGVDLVEAMRVAGGRYWSFTCPGANCCPAEGLPLHPERATAVDAAFAVGGAQALPSRDAMLDRLSPVAGAARAAAIKAIRRAEKEQGEPLRRRAREVVQRRICGERELPDVDDTARLSVAIADRRVRDYMLACVDEAGPRKTLELWIWVFRHVTREYRAECGVVLAYAAWRCGNGVMAAAAVREALSVDPHNCMAKLLCKVLGEGFPPGKLPKLTYSDVKIPPGASV